MSQYRFIQEEKAVFPVVMLCRVLRVARSAYYAWARRGVSARARADERLTVQITDAYTRSWRTYGAPRVHAELRAQGGVSPFARLSR